MFLLRQEFKFLKTVGIVPNEKSPDSGDTTIDVNSKSRDDDGGGGAGYFKKYADNGTPFDVQTDDDHNEDLFDTGVRSSS